jgi:hypothetical protein
VDVSATFKANTESAKIVKPGVSPFHNPSKFAEPTSVFGPALRDHGLDAEVPKRLTMMPGIIAAVGVDDFGLPKWAPSYAANRWNCLDQRQQLGDVVAVGARQNHTNRNPVGIYEDMVFRAGSRTIGGVRASFSPAPTARTDDESTAAREKSSWPASRKCASSNSCSRSHTPASVQSRRRRQHVAPDPKPRLVGRWFQRSPVLNTNRMPLSAARSDTGRRPGYARHTLKLNCSRLTLHHRYTDDSSRYGDDLVITRVFGIIVERVRHTTSTLFLLLTSLRLQVVGLGRYEQWSDRIECGCNDGRS